jgi:hypothetical protein
MLSRYCTTLFVVMILHNKQSFLPRHGDCREKQSGFFAGFGLVASSGRWLAIDPSSISNDSSSSVAAVTTVNQSAVNCSDPQSPAAFQLPSPVLYNNSDTVRKNGCFPNSHSRLSRACLGKPSRLKQTNAP